MTCERKFWNNGDSGAVEKVISIRKSGDTIPILFASAHLLLEFVSVRIREICG